MKRKLIMSLELKPFLFGVSLLAMAIMLSGCGKKGPLSLPQTSQIDTNFDAPNHSTRQPF